MLMVLLTCHLKEIAKNILSVVEQGWQRQRFLMSASAPDGCTATRRSTHITETTDHDMAQHNSFHNTSPRGTIPHAYCCCSGGLSLSLPLSLSLSLSLLLLL